MSSIDEISPVAKPRIDYNIWVDGAVNPRRVTCDNILEEGGYVRFMDGEIPAAIIPIARFAGVTRVIPKEPTK